MAWMDIESTPLWIVTDPQAPPRMVFSPSRISTWMGCNRKAGWEYFAGYRSPPTGATNFGGATHKILENMRRMGSLPDRTTDQGKCAAEIMLFWPPREDGETLEKEVAHQGRHAWRMIKDLQLPGLVVDYKTTSDFVWMKTVADLTYDPQAIAYAQHYFGSHPDADTVAMRWIYGKSKAPFSARPLDMTMTREHAALGFAALESYADEMQAAADACPPLEGKPGHDPVAVYKYVLTLHPSDDNNTGPSGTQCDAYGGCPHKARCGIPMFREKKKASNMSTLDRMLALQNAENGNPAPAAATPDPLAFLNGFMGAPTPQGNPWVPASPLEHVGAMAPALVPVENLPVSHAVIAAADVIATLPQVRLDNPVNPPRRAGRPAGSKNKPKMPSAEEIQPAVSPNTIAPSAELAALLQEAPLTGPVQSPATEQAPATAPTPAPTPTPTPTPTPAPAPASEVPLTGPVAIPPVAAPLKLIETLVVGAIIFGAPFTDFDAILQAAREAIGADAYFAGFGYKTNGAMLNMVCKILAAKPIETLVVRSPNLPEAALCLSYLRANASVLVEGL